MIATWVSEGQTATQVSGSLARTVPLEKDARNRAGMLSRFFASSVWSKWPRNANGHVLGELRTGVAEWEEPRHSGRLMPPRYPTFPHLATPSPTFPSGTLALGRPG